MVVVVALPAAGVEVEECLLKRQARPHPASIAGKVPTTLQLPELQWVSTSGRYRYLLHPEGAPLVELGHSPRRTVTLKALGSVALVQRNAVHSTFLRLEVA